jgi:hypothetical protein
MNAEHRSLAGCQRDFCQSFSAEFVEAVYSAAILGMNASRWLDGDTDRHGRDKVVFCSA